MSKIEILKRITSYYINSNDFNGIPYDEIKIEYMDLNENMLKTIIVDLIKEKKITLNYTINPYIKQYNDFPITQQISVLNNNTIKQICLYPTEEHLTTTLEEIKYSDKPFTNMLYLGKPQLEPLFFEMSILNDYFNESGYHINVISDYSGSIAYNYKDRCKKDKILLPVFEFGYVKKSKEKVVAACLRHLNILSVEHQSKWMSYLITGEECQTVYGGYHNSIFGEWVENASIYEAFIEELFHINEMSLKIFGERIFKEDFKKNRPEGFRPLFIPNKKNYYEFVHVLDNMMSENINIAFFAEVQAVDKSTIQLLDEWLRKKVRLLDDKDYTDIINPFIKVGIIKQELARGINNNHFNKEYISEQRLLIKETYESIKKVRMLFADHPAIKGYKIPDWLNRDNLIIF
ncbi:MAG: hypothetical protein A4E52_01303 [Pelotomaculum sp. PtaB.Bin013]|uniref:Uncharacterized protein n=1 Tax=Pelotomaculum isophthalicicum JI TaxID=947010 RepID=A0A9X4H8G5_9FIRM|nr:hypothetical protein [Pelotomaculum isophthalicicum]MDF9408944.1 hypothetical protein [Pelotomaculum isophthalicicum JI]OPX87992.1 MAG: hypothetical protein A4E52_01303 [Pelotomaculum sp. PtaB.Bin013]